MISFFFLQRTHRDLAYMVIWTIVIYSKSAHKGSPSTLPVFQFALIHADAYTSEFRFVLPLLPAAIVYAGFCLRQLELHSYRRLSVPTQTKLLKLACGLTVIPNLIAAGYLSRWHQVVGKRCMKPGTPLSYCVDME